MSAPLPLPTPPPLPARGQRWCLELEPIIGGDWKAAPSARLRRALKSLRRSYGLRCLRIQDVSEQREGG